MGANSLKCTHLFSPCYNSSGCPPFIGNFYGPWVLLHTQAILCLGGLAGPGLLTQDIKNGEAPSGPTIVA